MSDNHAVAVDWGVFVDQVDREQQLTWLQERGFDEAYDNGKRKLGLACALAAVLGVFGAHRFYLRECRTAILMSTVTLAGLVLATVISIFFHDTATRIIGEFIAGLMLLSTCVWAVVDLFRIPSMVQNFNTQLSTEIKLKLRAGFFI